jgi:hypothetical protein
MILTREFSFAAHRLTLFILVVFILDINMMLDIDFHVLALQLHMDNKLNFKVLSYEMLLVQLVVKQ